MTQALTERTAVIGHADRARLQRLLVAGGLGYRYDRDELRALQTALSESRVASEPDGLRGVVTLDVPITAVALDSGDVVATRVTLPTDAGATPGAVSVLTRLGRALLGVRVGETVEWRTPRGPRRARVERVRPAGAESR
jgi:transcription elongation GreA/GreB family factor